MQRDKAYPGDNDKKKYDEWSNKTTTVERATTKQYGECPDDIAEDSYDWEPYNAKPMLSPFTYRGGTTRSGKSFRTVPYAARIIATRPQTPGAPPNS